jgi:hypothetical protein
LECGLGSRLGPTPLECGLGPRLGPRLERGLASPSPVICRLGSRLGLGSPLECRLASGWLLGPLVLTLPQDGLARLLPIEIFLVQAALYI